MNIVFLCTGNSCRSILAEGILKSFKNKNFQAFSAGSNPTKAVHPLSLEVLKSHKIATDNFYSKSLKDLKDISIDIIITVCDHAKNEPCPLVLEDCIKAHWGVEDPPKVKVKKGHEIEPFETTFQILKLRIEALLKLDLKNLSKNEIENELNEIGKNIKE